MAEKDTLGLLGRLEIACAARGTKITLYMEKAALIEGHKGIRRFTSEAALFNCSEGEAVVRGEDLTIRHISKGTALIEGRIKGAELL